MKPLSSQPLLTPQVTFVLHEAGETKAMMPVMQQLDQSKVPYAVIANGAAKKLLNGHPNLLPSGDEVVFLSRQNPAQGARIEKAFEAAAQAPVSVVGLKSPLQQQWAGLTHQLGKQVVGFYDSFNLDTTKTMVDGFWQNMTTLIAPSRDTAQFFQQRFPQLPVMTLGHPTLEAIGETIAQTNPAVLAQRLGISLGVPTLLFVGGWGPGYAEAFELFCQTLQYLPNVQVLVSVHPQEDGQMEQGILSRYGLQGKVKLLPTDVTAAKALSVSQMVLSHDSTMTFQALFHRKHVMLLGESVGNGQVPLWNPAIAYGLVPRYRSFNELYNGLVQRLNAMSLSSSSVPYTWDPGWLHQLLGIPQAATHQVTQFLLGLVAGAGRSSL